MRSSKSKISELGQSVFPKDRLRIFSQIPEDMLHSNCVIIFTFSQEMDVVCTDLIWIWSEKVMLISPHRL